MCVRVHKDCLALILLHSYRIDSEMSDVSLDPLTRIVLCSIGRSPEEGGCAPVCSWWHTLVTASFLARWQHWTSVVVQECPSREYHPCVLWCSCCVCWLLAVIFLWRVILNAHRRSAHFEAGLIRLCSLQEEGARDVESTFIVALEFDSWVLKEWILECYSVDEGVYRV